MKTPADWLHLMNWRPPTLSMVEAIQADASAELECRLSELRGTIEDLKQVNRFVNAENAKMREILDKLEHNWVSKDATYCDDIKHPCPRCRWETLKKEIKP